MAPLGEADETLMARTAEGDRACLELLVRRHATPLLTFLARMSGDRHRAEELFQEVFLAVWVKRRLYQYPRPFKPWLYAIAMNKFRATFRARAAPSAQLTAESFADAGESPADAVIAAETADLVGRAVARLPEQQRAVVTLRVWEGLPYARIAEIVACSEATVRSHMHHGLAALRKQLEPMLAQIHGERGA
ncbi:MAG TPA: sigma-70 family RNA polymerase sigma factor [Gemmataceae bacterium]|nr:sigma-70 family RNA polymerase sigma factor [Gemmataceae bacterium]